MAVMVPLVTGCLHHNVVHNSRTLYEDAERHRRSGQDSLARVVYEDVVRKTAQALQARPDGEWADEARSLQARSHLRLGDYRPARRLLEEVATEAAAPALRMEARAHLAVAAAAIGDEARALDLAERLLADTAGPVPTALAHLVRGRIFAARGFLDRAWWEFDRAVEYGPGLAVEVDLERVASALGLGDEARAGDAFVALLSNDRATPMVDSVLSLLDHSARVWGDATAAHLVRDVPRSPWARDARSRVELARARLLDRAGETSAAVDAAEAVTSGRGASAAEGRLLLAGWRLADAVDLSVLPGVRALLLPTAADARAAEMIASLDRLERLADTGLEEPLAWFGAGEIARDDLGADHIARGFFLAYVDQAPSGPWAPKAILAAIAMTPDEEDRAWLRGRLEGHGDSPYVLAAHGGPAAGYAALEEELDVRLTELGQR